MAVEELSASPGAEWSVLQAAQQQALRQQLAPEALVNEQVTEVHDENRLNEADSMTARNADVTASRGQGQPTCSSTIAAGIGS